VRHLFRVTVLVGLLAAVGCSDPRKDATVRLRGQVDEARRRYMHATALLANPTYIHRTTSQMSPVYIKIATSQAIEIPETQPTERAEALDLLNKARADLMSGVNGSDAAPASLKALAQQLIGDIELARGRVHAAGAETFKQNAARHRRQALSHLAVADNNLLVAEYYRQLVAMPQAEIQKMRLDTTAAMKTATDKIAAIEGEVATLKTEMDKLVKDNESLSGNARGLRVSSEKASGTQGLELLREAQAIEARMDANAGKVSADQQRIEVLGVDRVLMQVEKQGVESKLAVIEERVKNRDTFAVQAAAAIKAARQVAGKSLADAAQEAAVVASGLASAAAREKQGIEAFSTAVAYLGQALSSVQSARSPGPPVPAEEAQATSVTSLRGAASLGMADISMRQLQATAANGVLAKGLTATAKTLGQEVPAAVKEIESYIADSASVRKDAVAAYQEAQKDLETVRSSPSPEIAKAQWIYQGQLADAYLGHYQLTNDASVKAKAKQLLTEALASKANSPFVESLLRMQRMLEEPPLPSAPVAPAAPAVPAPTEPPAP